MQGLKSTCGRSGDVALMRRKNRGFFGCDEADDMVPTDRAQNRQDSSDSLFDSRLVGEFRRSADLQSIAPLSHVSRAERRAM